MSIGVSGGGGGGLTKDAGEPTLRVIRGRIDTTAGTILQGTGFSVARDAAGDVTITFDTAFAAVPVVVGSAESSAARDVKNHAAPTTTTATLRRFDTTLGGGSDGVLDFVAIGEAP